MIGDPRRESYDLGPDRLPVVPPVVKVPHPEPVQGLENDWKQKPAEQRARMARARFSGPARRPWLVPESIALPSCDRPYKISNTSVATYCPRAGSSPWRCQPGEHAGRWRRSSAGGLGVQRLRRSMLRSRPGSAPIPGSSAFQRHSSTGSYATTPPRSVQATLRSGQGVPSGLSRHVVRPHGSVLVAPATPWGEGDEPARRLRSRRHVPALGWQGSSVGTAPTLTRP